MQNIELDYRRVKLGAARCGADMSNGSERAEFVPMREVFTALKRPPRAINIMFTYYPQDKGWPKRASDVNTLTEGMGQWDLPYDDYFPYLGGPGGKPDAEVFNQCRDVRRFGSDVHLTLTIDLNTPDESLVVIARDLRPFGRFFLRINHECNGSWFQHNKRFTKQQVGDFFAKFHTIIKREAPLVRTVFCINAFETPEALELDNLVNGIRAADILAIDRYISLHYAWPRKWDGDKSHYYDNTFEQWRDYTEMTLRELAKRAGKKEIRVTLPEINADSDVNGFDGQARLITQLYQWVAKKKPRWIEALTFYQFRDRGGLGLELEDSTTHGLARQLPSLTAYREAVDDRYYMPPINRTGGKVDAKNGAVLRWEHAESAEGLFLRGTTPKGATSLTVELPPGNFMIECAGKWVHNDGKNRVAVPAPKGGKFEINIFAPPANGENLPDGKGGYVGYWEAKLDFLPRVTM